MTRLDPDPDRIADRTPAACPFCTWYGAFDAQGEFPDEIVITRAGVTTTYDATWTQVRFPECNGRFQMLTDTEKVSVES